MTYEVQHIGCSTLQGPKVDMPRPLESLGVPKAFETHPHIDMTYLNYRGEVSRRRVIPLRIWFGATEWHPEPGWLMTAHDIEKGADRDFALADCQFAEIALRPVAWQWRSRFKGAAWDAWENGRYGEPIPPFMDVEERPLYAAEMAVSVDDPSQQCCLPTESL